LLIVSCSDNDKVTKSQTSLPPSAKPVAHFEIDPVGGPYYAGDTLTFDASASYDPQSDSLIYFWNLGDGTESDERICVHIYTAEGRFKIMLVVKNSAGYADTCTKHLNISPPSRPLDKPVARFRIIPLNNSFHAEDTLKFDASESYDPQADPLIYYWDLGDGTNSNEEVFLHSYEKEGFYPVVLIVEDTQGYADTCIVGLNILEPFPRAIIDSVDVLMEKKGFPFPVRYFYVTSWFTLRHFPNAIIYLKLQIREIDGGWPSVHPPDTFQEMRVRSDAMPFTSFEEFTYGALTGALWPKDSAMVITSIWRDKSMSEWLVTIDTTIAHYSDDQ